MRARGEAWLWACALAGLSLAAAMSAPTSAGGDEGETLALDCRPGRGDVAAMEAEYVEQGCWAHLGMHHYFLGADALYALRAGSGRVFSVEQQLSPPVELGDLHPAPPQANSTLVVETSLDGLDWEPVADIEYVLYRVLPPTLLMDLRQEIHFVFESAEEPLFRFLRVRQPISAMQGLSGFLDFSALTLDVRVAAAPAAPVPAHQEVQRDCQDGILEAVFAAHPCFFGGVNRYDAPSFFHTYPLERGRLDAVDVTATALYWRPEDPGTGHGQSVPGVTTGELLLLGSLDGVAWVELGRAPIRYGEPVSVSFAPSGAEVSFLRLAADKHPGYWNHPALKHPEGFLVDSALRVKGDWPLP